MLARQSKDSTYKSAIKKVTREVILQIRKKTLPQAFMDSFSKDIILVIEARKS